MVHVLGVLQQVLEGKKLVRNRMRTDDERLPNLVSNWKACTTSGRNSTGDLLESGRKLVHSSLCRCAAVDPSEAINHCYRANGEACGFAKPGTLKESQHVKTQSQRGHGGTYTCYDAET